jgi:transposase
LDLDLVVRRHELTDEQWQVIEPLLPVSGAKGRPRVDDRRVINGMLVKAKTGVAWRDLPERYGPWKTAHERLRKWTADGTWDRILTEVVIKDDAVGAVEWTISVDSSSVRAHQHAAGARKKMTCGGTPSAQRTVGCVGLLELEEVPDADRRRTGRPPAADHLRLSR